MRGTFTAVVHGEWATGRRRQGLAVVAVVLLLLCGGSVIRFAPLLWVVAAVAVLVLAAAAAVAVLALRAWNRQQAGQFVTMLATLPAERPTVTAPPVQTTVIQHFHGGTHLHVNTGTDTSGLNHLVSDAISERGELT